MSKHTFRIVVDLDDFPEEGFDGEEEESGGALIGEIYTVAENFDITKNGDLILSDVKSNCFAVASGYWKMVNRITDLEGDSLDRQEDNRSMAVRRAEEGVLTPDESTPTGK